MSASRKDDHVRLALEQYREQPAPRGPELGGSSTRTNAFDHVHFVHHALAATDQEEVRLTTEFAGVVWPAPLYINAMTGGSEKTGEINRLLAIAARETGLPMATGSMSPYLKDPSTAETFATVRRHHPDGFVMANVNALASPEQARRAVGLLNADALQIHLNTVQELVMPEGDRSFACWPANIQGITEAVEVPVVVKEVGFGLSGRTVSLLADLGVAVADVAGSGGTNFAVIENSRRPRSDYTFLRNWGLSTPAALLDAQGAGLPLLASGGVRTPLDVVRALTLGARAAGVSGLFLSTLQHQGLDALIDQIRQWLSHITDLMTLLGARCPAELTSADVVLTGELRDFQVARLAAPDSTTRKAL